VAYGFKALGGGGGDYELGEPIYTQISPTKLLSPILQPLKHQERERERGGDYPEIETRTGPYTIFLFPHVAQPFNITTTTGEMV